MKAAVVTGRRRFEVRELPTPKVQPGTLLLKVRRSAICGTDLEHIGLISGSFSCTCNCTGAV